MNEQIGNYKLLKKCGRGGYGDVWMAQDISGRYVALKILDKSAAIERELAGLRACKDLGELPGVIRVLHIGETADCFYYTMELADSLSENDYIPATLSNILKSRKRLQKNELMLLAKQLLNALAILHNLHLIHRDVKPENIIVVNGQFKISDIGLMRSDSHTLSLAGTLGFIPPERLANSSGCQSAGDDVYAAGKVLYCAWTGNPPEQFPSLPPEMIGERWNNDFNQAITRACAYDQRKRFASAKDFLETLENPETIPEKSNCKWLKFVLPAAALLILGGIASWKWRTADLPAPYRKAPLPAPEPKPDKTDDPIIEFSVSDGNEANRTTYYFTESPTPVNGTLVIKNRLSDLRIWDHYNLRETVCSPDTINFQSKAKGKIHLRRPLPDNYRIAFDLDINQLQKSISFVISHANNISYQFGIARIGNTLLLTPLEKWQNGRRIKIAAMPVKRWWRNGKRKVEIIRSGNGFKINADGKTLLTVPEFERGGRFSISADCGQFSDCKISDFALFRL